MRRLASSDLLFRYVEEVSDLSAARIRRCRKFELEASSPSPLIGTISTSRRVSALPDLEWFLSHIRETGVNFGDPILRLGDNFTVPRLT